MWNCLDNMSANIVDKPASPIAKNPQSRLQSISLEVKALRETSGDGTLGITESNHGNPNPTKCTFAKHQKNYNFLSNKLKKDLIPEH